MAARTVEYEPATGVPPEYVEFLPKQDVVAALPWLLEHKGVAWIRANCANQAKLLGLEKEEDDAALAESLAAMRIDGSADQGEAASASGSEGGSKPAAASKKKGKGAPHVTLTLASRAKRKAVTTISGLDKFEVKLGEASKLFGKKFACGSSVVKDSGTNREEIDVQGDMVEGIRELILKTWKNIGEDDITIVDKRK